MKIIPYLFCAAAILLGFQMAEGQKRTGASGRRTLKSIVRTPPEPKVEIEKWQEFEDRDLKLKLAFPKEPNVTANSYTEGSVTVNSSIIQSYVNQIYYMVEVREYPEDFLPARTDLGENYGAWLKRFILSRTNIISEKTVAYGRFSLVEFIYQQSETELLVHRAMVGGRKLYQIIVQLEIKKPDTLEQTIEKNREKIDKFFLSFEITDKDVSDTTNG